MSGIPPAAGEPVSEPLLEADELRDEIAQLHEAIKAQRAIGMAVGLVSAYLGHARG